VQTSTIRDLQTRFKHLDVLDWAAIVIFFVGVLGAIYALTLRHP
jgi:hypothetical protein